MLESKYLLEEGKSAPDGTEVIECTECKSKFAVPAEMAKEIKDKICEGCSEAKKKMEAVASAVAMKTSDAADTIKTALGK